jgi:hypothetical protein
MKKSSILILLILFPLSLAHSQNFYYPLSIGNRWVYADDVHPYSFEVKILSDTILPNGKKYSISSNSSLYRYEDNKLYRLYGIDATTEYLECDFTKSPKDTIAKYEWGSFLILDRIRTDTLFGRVLRQFTFSYYIVPDYLGHKQIIADSVGLIFETGEPPYAYSLEGAIVDGKQYGMITRVWPDYQQSPSDFSLHQNYPNPFNPTTTIRYELPEQSLVSLKVFNILGQHIATLVNETQSAGSKLTKFNANTLSNGVYYYTLSAVNSRNSFTQTHKMLLAK